LMLAQGRLMDTIIIATLVRNRGFDFTGVMRLPSTTITAVLGGDDFMAVAHGKTDFLISVVRGYPWQTAAKPPGTVSKLAGTPNRMFALADSLLYASTDSAKTWTSLPAPGFRIATVAGTASLLAALSEDRRRVLVSADTARTWPALPALPSGTDSVLTDVAVQGGQVLVGTRDAGVFSWGDPGPTAVRPQTSAGAGVAARSIRRGWIHVPGQGLRLRLDPNTQVDARGRLSLPVKASGPE
jgi:hypothetical protein